LFEPVLGARQLYHFYLNSANKVLTPKVSYHYFIRLAARIGISSRKFNSAAELRTRALLQTLIADLVEYVEYDIRSGNIGSELDSIGERISEITIFIDSHLQNKSLPADIFDNFGTTEKTLYRLLKSVMGQTLKDIIITARVEKSKRLLRETDKRVAAIADECGFLCPFLPTATGFTKIRRRAQRRLRLFMQGVPPPIGVSNTLPLFFGKRRERCNHRLMYGRRRLVFHLILEMF
jgi:AraC-like DNA-binding protein